MQGNADCPSRETAGCSCFHRASFVRLMCFVVEILLFKAVVTFTTEKIYAELHNMRLLTFLADGFEAEFLTIENEDGTT